MSEKIYEKHFTTSVNKWGGYIIKYKNVSDYDENTFSILVKLVKSIEEHGEKTIRSIWVYAPDKRIMNYRFDFRKYDEKEKLLCFTKWICKFEKNSLPPALTHICGVSCIFIKDGEILLVKEKYGNFFKFPGGRVDKGENPKDAVVREIKEEVGIDIYENVGLVGVFQIDNWEFGKNSDNVFLYSSKYRGEEFKLQKTEISEVKWVNLNWFMNTEHKSSIKQMIKGELIKFLYRK